MSSGGGLAPRDDGRNDDGGPAAAPAAPAPCSLDPDFEFHILDSWLRVQSGPTSLFAGDSDVYTERGGAELMRMAGVAPAQLERWRDARARPALERRSKERERKRERLGRFLKDREQREWPGSEEEGLEAHEVGVPRRKDAVEVYDECVSLIGGAVNARQRRIRSTEERGRESAPRELRDRASSAVENMYQEIWERRWRKERVAKRERRKRDLASSSLGQVVAGWNVDGVLEEARARGALPSLLEGGIGHEHMYWQGGVWKNAKFDPPATWKKAKTSLEFDSPTKDDDDEDDDDDDDDDDRPHLSSRGGRNNVCNPLWSDEYEEGHDVESGAGYDAAYGSGDEGDDNNAEGSQSPWSPWAATWSVAPGAEASADDEVDRSQKPDLRAYVAVDDPALSAHECERHDDGASGVVLVPVDVDVDLVVPQPDLKAYVADDEPCPFSPVADEVERDHDDSNGDNSDEDEGKREDDRGVVAPVYVTMDVLNIMRPKSFIDDRLKLGEGSEPVEEANTDRTVSSPVPSLDAWGPKNAHPSNPRVRRFIDANQNATLGMHKKASQRFAPKASRQMLVHCVDSAEGDVNKELNESDIANVSTYCCPTLDGIAAGWDWADWGYRVTSTESRHEQELQRPRVQWQGKKEKRRHKMNRKACRHKGCRALEHVHLGGYCADHRSQHVKICSIEGCHMVAMAGECCFQHGGKVIHCNYEGCHNPRTKGTFCDQHFNGVCLQKGCDAEAVWGRSLCADHINHVCAQEGCSTRTRKSNLCKVHLRQRKSERRAEQKAKGGPLLCADIGCLKRAIKFGLCLEHCPPSRLCKYDGCTTFAKEGGVCIRHGARRNFCNHDGCTNNAVKGGVCIRHGAETKKRKTCSHDGCTNQAISGGVCCRHGATKTRKRRTC